jgi:hypothetical protein
MLKVSCECMSLNLSPFRWIPLSLMHCGEKVSRWIVPLNVAGWREGVSLNFPFKSCSFARTCLADFVSLNNEGRRARSNSLNCPFKSGRFVRTCLADFVPLNNEGRRAGVLLNCPFKSCRLVRTCLADFVPLNNEGRREGTREGIPLNCPFKWYRAAIRLSLSLPL